MLVQCGNLSFNLIQFGGIHLCVFGGEFVLNFYGFVLMLGAVAGGFLAASEVKRRGRDPEMVWDLLVYLIIGGVVGARLWHIFTPPPSSIAQGFTTQFYLTHPLDMLNIRNGGLGIPGTIMGGLIALYFYSRKYPVVSFIEWTDIAAPALALGQAIGRWGNFFNQELYGAPTNLPWKIFIDPAHRLAGFQNDAYYHPLFLYESVLNLLNMLFLLWITREYTDKLKRGDVFNIYLIIYPVIRFSLDFLRLDASQIAGINANQTLMAVVAVLATATLIWRHRPGAGESIELPELAPAPVGAESDMAALDSEPEPTVQSTVKKAAVKKPAQKAAAKKAAVKKTTAKKPVAKKSAE